MTISPLYQKVLHLFQKHDCDYLILRYPHLLPRAIYDLDLLLRTEQGYRIAVQLLREQDFVCIDRERYRGFWAKKEGNELLVIDLYKEVSWLGWVVLEKEKLFRRRKKLNSTIIVPSDEDELSVYMGQALFKNNGLDEYKTRVVQELLQRRLDWEYITKQVKHHGWHGPFIRLRQKVKEGKTVRCSPWFFIQTVLSTMIRKPSRVAVLGRAVKYAGGTLFPRRKATSVCFLGPDGSGKTTVGERLSDEYPLLFRKFNLKARKLYFGWKPFLPTTKLLSSSFKKRDYKVVEKMNRRKEKFSLVQEMVLLYCYIEYLCRYFWSIYPQKPKKMVILIDRYFYDMYAHYRYAKRSLLFPLLLRWYPKPDYTFVLEVPPRVLQRRKDELTKEQLEEHLETYTQLTRKLNLHPLCNDQPIDRTINTIIEKTWRTIVRRVA